VELFGDEVERISVFDPLTGEVLSEGLPTLAVYPAKHYVTPADRIDEAMRRIRAELAERLKDFKAQGKLLEAQRLEQRTRYDLEMLKEMVIARGWRTMPGIWNSACGRATPCLLDYFRMTI